MRYAGFLLPIFFLGPLCAHAESNLNFYSKLTTLFGDSWVGPGFSVGVQAPVGTRTTRDFFQLGGQIATYHQASTWLLDASASASGLYTIRLPKNAGFLTPYVQVLVGPSVYFNNPANWGYHFAILPGVRYSLDRHWSVFGELGYSFHALTSGTPVSRNISAGSFSIGVVYEL